MELTITKLRKEAILFCKHESNIPHKNLIGITDGKAVGTYIEHKFKEYLKNKYDITIGSSAKGIDLPDPEINTDIKVTSIKKPQSSSPFKNIEQKVYGLGYNLLIFVYEKKDIDNNSYLDFKHCIFLEKDKTADYNLTKVLRKMIELNAKKNDIIEILNDRNVPGDEQILEPLAKKILKNPPKQGYLTISNAFQWRLKYNNILNLKTEIPGVYNYERHDGRDLENYQTPLYFTNRIYEYLKNNLKINPDIIIEPTCGIGNFLKSASKAFPQAELYGIDIDKDKLNQIEKIPNLKLINKDILTFKFDNLNENKTFLIIGNPSWITSTKLSNIDSKNMLINSNFDISEHIILKIINEFKGKLSTIVFICKTTTLKNIFMELIENNIEYSLIKQININSDEIFNIDLDVCLFILKFGGGRLTNNTCEVSDISNPSKVIYTFSFKEGKFYSNINGIPPIDGTCQMNWRQGIKHDCAKIMELTYENQQLTNNNNESVSIENILLYPLLKSSNLKKPIVNNTSKYIIITQKTPKQDTQYIENYAPETWKYLNNNKFYFDRRKSSNYNNSPNFSISGIGDYLFKKYKVVISGFNKKPIFSLAYNEKTMIVDDSCYYISFDDYDNAYITMLILNSKIVKEFLKNIASLDSKRPFSKKVLKRIDFRKCLDILSLDDLKEIEKELKLKSYITSEKFIKYKNNLKNHVCKYN